LYDFLQILIGFNHVEWILSDESGSDSEGGESEGSTSSYSSLSDFVSELASSDLSPCGPGSGVHRRKLHSRTAPTPEESGESVKETRQSRESREADRNVTSLCSSLDLFSVYFPPAALQYGGDLEKPVAGSPSGSGSGSDSESDSTSGEDDQSGSRRASVDPKSDRKDSGGTEDSTGAETSSHKEHKEASRQGSLLGHIASQAKELVKETKRQGSQEGLLSQVDKVYMLKSKNMLRI